MKRSLTNFVAGILAAIATAGPASADCDDSMVRIMEGVNQSSVVSSVIKHVKASKGHCDSGTILDERYRTLGRYSFDKQWNRITVTPYDGKFQSESVPYDRERD